jgi:Family of unknown function (DUF6350)
MVRVSLLFGRSPASAARHAVARRLPAVVAGLLGGALAAGLGLGVFAVVVLFLWVTSPSSDSNPGGALHIAAALWLLAHGGDLVRVRTAGGVPAPVGLTPLLLTVLPVWLLNRVGAHAVDEPRRTRGAHRAVRRRHRLGTGATVVCLAAGYCLVAAAALLYTASGPLPGRPATALVSVPPVALLAAASGAWSVRGLPDLPLPDRFARVVDRLVPWRATAVALRAAVAGTLVLVAGGAVLAAVSLVRHAPLAASSFAGLSQAPWGRFAVLLLSAALAPNAAVWGAAYALTPGFAVGVGSSVSPEGTWYPHLPDLPLLAALPAQGGRATLGWLALTGPVLAGIAVGATVARQARGAMRGLWGMRDTALVAGLGAVGVGLAMAALAGLGSGPLGAHRLAELGPHWRETGTAAFTWTAALGVPAAVILRWRPPRDDEPPEPEDRWWPWPRAERDEPARAGKAALVAARPAAPARDTVPPGRSLTITPGGLSLPVQATAATSPARTAADGPPPGPRILEPADPAPAGDPPAPDQEPLSP